MGADLPLEVVAHSWFADEHYRIPQHSWYGYQGTKTESQWVGAPGGITGPLFPALSLTGGARCQHVLRLASLVKNSLTGQRGKDGEINSLSSSLQADFTHPICEIGDVSPQECPPPLVWNLRLDSFFNTTHCGYLKNAEVTTKCR